mgnify:CR=1 FL=1
MTRGFRPGVGAAMAVALLALAGCGLEGKPPVAQADRSLADGSRDREASRVGDMFALTRDNPDAAGGGSLSVNRFLWLASLDTLSFMPLTSTDPFSGVIVTDWATNAESPDERYKVTVYVNAPALAPSSLRVAVFREVRAPTGVWVAAEVSEATPRRLEDAILTRARQLRVAELEADRRRG